MSVKIRLARRGRRKAPFYHIVVADARSPRDGRFIENLGKYNPLTSPATIELDRDKAFEWLMKGAQPTETARAILRFKGVMFRKHLARGVAKGALTEEKALQMYNDFVEAKEAKIAQRFEETKAKKAEYWKTISGEPKAKVVDPGSAEKELEQFQNVEVTEADTNAGEAVEAAAEAKVEEVAEATAETKAEEVKEAAPEAKVEEAAEAAVETKAEEVKEAVADKLEDSAKEKAAPVVAAAAAAATTATDAADAKPVEDASPAEEASAPEKKEEVVAEASTEEE